MLKRLFRKNTGLGLEYYKDSEFSDDYSLEEGQDEDLFTSYEENDDSLERVIPAKKKLKKRIGFIFFLVLIFLFVSSIDFVCVSRWNVGPFFAVRTNVYNDGGTKVYYGLFYKVIKYHQKQGRRDTEIGFWNMPYSVTPVTTTALDLAIESTDDFSSFMTNYKQSFLRVTGEILQVNRKNKQITIGYLDSSNKYTFHIVCSLADSKKVSPALKKGQMITVLGTVLDVSKKSEIKKMYMRNCFLGNPKDKK